MVILVFLDIVGIVATYILTNYYKNFDLREYVYAIENKDKSLAEIINKFRKLGFTLRLMRLITLILILVTIAYIILN